MLWHWIVQHHYGVICRLFWRSYFQGFAICSLVKGKFSYKFYQEVTLPLRKKQVEMGVELQQEFRLNCFKNLILGFSKIIEPVSYQLPHSHASDFRIFFFQRLHSWIRQSSLLVSCWLVTNGQNNLYRYQMYMMNLFEIFYTMQLLFVTSYGQTHYLSQNPQRTFNAIQLDGFR